MNIYDGRKKPAQKNDTGIPDKLKQSLEAKYSIPLDDVRVHMKSSKPDALDALAYTQGRNVYIGPGQEQHLPHELGHVMQQKMKKVQGSYQKKGISINDDSQLEKEATNMGKAAVQMVENGVDTNTDGQHTDVTTNVGENAVQMMAKHAAERLEIERKARENSASLTHPIHGRDISKRDRRKGPERSASKAVKRTSQQAEQRMQNELADAKKKGKSEEEIAQL